MKWPILALAATLLAILFIFLNSEPTAQQENKMIRLSSSTKEVVFDPAKGLSYQQFIIMHLFNDTLTTVTQEGRIVSGIAESWEVSQDRRTYTFNLDKRALFHNNKPITAHDVAFSLSKHFYSDSKSVVKTALITVLDGIEIDQNTKYIPAITIINADKISIRLKEPYAPFLKILAMTGYSIISSDSSKKRPIGSGPYKFESFSDGIVHLNRFENYFGERPSPKGFSIRLIRELGDIKKAFNTEEIDLAIGAPIELLDPDKLPKNVSFQPSNTLVMTNLFLNQNNPLFERAESRKDFSGLVNYIKASPNLLTEFDQPLNSLLPKGIMPYSYYDRTPISMAPNDFREKWGLSNQPLRCIFPKGLFNSKFIRFFNSTLEEAGFKPEITEAKGDDLLQPVMTGNFDFVILPYLGIIPDADGYIEIVNPDGLLKAANIPSRPLVKELNNYRFTREVATRLERYEEAFKKFESEQYIIPIAQQNLPILFRDNLKIPDMVFRFHVDLREVFWENQ